MRQSSTSGRGLDRVLEEIAWKTTIGFILAMPTVLLGFWLLAFSLTPKAASAQLTPNWRLSWEALSQDEPCPTPQGGTYCDATLSRRRVCLGPVEVRYSVAN